MMASISIQTVQRKYSVRYNINMFFHCGAMTILVPQCMCIMNSPNTISYIDFSPVS